MKVLEYDILTKMIARFGKYTDSDQFGDVHTYFFQSDSRRIDLQIAPDTIQIHLKTFLHAIYGFSNDLWYINVHNAVGSYSEMTDEIIESLV